jgi:hypothetical protein
MIGKSLLREKIEKLYDRRRQLAFHSDWSVGLWRLDRELFRLYFRPEIAETPFMESAKALKHHLLGAGSIPWLMTRDSWSAMAREAIQPEIGINDVFGEEVLPAHLLAGMGYHPKAVLETLSGESIGTIRGVQGTAIEACCVYGGCLEVGGDISAETLFRGYRRETNNLLAACNFHRTVWYRSGGEDDEEDPWEFLHWKECALLADPCGVGYGHAPEGILLRRLLSRPAELQLHMTLPGEDPDSSIRVADYLSDHINRVGMSTASLSAVRACRRSWGILVSCPDIGNPALREGSSPVSGYTVPLPLSILLSYHHDWLDRSHEDVDPIFFGALDAWGGGNSWEGYRAYFGLPQEVRDLFERMGFAEKDLRANYAALSAARGMHSQGIGPGSEEPML